MEDLAQTEKGLIHATDYDAFRKQLDSIAPVYPDEPGLFDDPKDWDKPSSL
jgi:hypothetical protein